MTKGWNGQYITTLNKEQKLDYYDAQIAFWESVIRKHPDSKSKYRNRAQLGRMKIHLRREIEKQ